MKQATDNGPLVWPHCQSPYSLCSALFHKLLFSWWRLSLACIVYSALRFVLELFTLVKTKYLLDGRLLVKFWYLGISILLITISSHHIQLFISSRVILQEEVWYSCYAKEIHSFAHLSVYLSVRLIISSSQDGVKSIQFWCQC